MLSARFVRNLQNFWVGLSWGHSYIVQGTKEALAKGILDRTKICHRLEVLIGLIPLLPLRIVWTFPATIAANEPIKVSYVYEGEA